MRGYGICSRLPRADHQFGASRRGFLRHLAAAAAGTFLSPSASALSILFPKERELSFFNLHTEEKLLIPYCPARRCPPSVLSKVNYLLRDHRAEKVHPIDPALLDILHAISVLSGSRGTFQVISGYRAPETNTMLHQTTSGVASQSLHTEGKAIDVQLSDVNTQDMRQIAAGLRLGGVGYYPESDFVHLDTGAVRTW